MRVGGLAVGGGEGGGGAGGPAPHPHPEAVRHTEHRILHIGLLVVVGSKAWVRLRAVNESGGAGVLAQGEGGGVALVVEGAGRGMALVRTLVLGLGSKDTRAPRLKLGLGLWTELIEAATDLVVKLLVVTLEENRVNYRKLDGVAPLMTDPPPTGFPISFFFFFNMLHMNRDTSPMTCHM